MSEKPEFITPAGIRERGWTNGLIRDFLGEPDKTVCNPHYSSAGSPMKLYNLDKVSAVENTPEFITAKTKAVARSVAAKKTAAIARDKLLAQVESMNITVQINKIVFR